MVQLHKQKAHFWSKNRECDWESEQTPEWSRSSCATDSWAAPCPRDATSSAMHWHTGTSGPQTAREGCAIPPESGKGAAHAEVGFSMRWRSWQDIMGDSITPHTAPDQSVQHGRLCCKTALQHKRGTPNSRQQIKAHGALWATRVHEHGRHRFQPDDLSHHPLKGDSGLEHLQPIGEQTLRDDCMRPVGPAIAVPLLKFGNGKVHCTSPTGWSFQPQLLQWTASFYLLQTVQTEKQTQLTHWFEPKADATTATAHAKFTRLHPAHLYTAFPRVLRDVHGIRTTRMW
eukprot:CAMPEP_0174360718 /NCGR_PEP_ID=MMETSP0811_2-20130205/55701_1 /TAXON_ID=73025 ORGANISM="Eutreptiella gymnastica-like, Strain CCMP1594" /NCGR_SAMPLE_ID=MMETSP0811_2 /ASSEMBLY_ACC=CAM_ASM_000667 /LENGTH=285 /DNA_ID=CAMNT_0015496761 /DNA_START=334 /DNA_END=1188 /DNA_ORIENTATION=+